MSDEPVHLIHVSPATGYVICDAEDWTLSTAYRREATCPACLERTDEDWEAAPPSLKETRKRVSRRR